PIGGVGPTTDAYDVRVNTAAGISIFEVADASTAGAYAHHIQGGDYFGTDPAAHILLVVDYAGRARFYATGENNLQYVRADMQMLRLLASVLGQPFTQGPA